MFFIYKIGMVVSNIESLCIDENGDPFEWVVIIPIFFSNLLFFARNP